MKTVYVDRNGKTVAVKGSRLNKILGINTETAKEFCKDYRLSGTLTTAFGNVFEIPFREIEREKGWE